MGIFLFWQSQKVIKEFLEVPYNTNMDTIFFRKSITASAIAVIIIVSSLLTGCHQDASDVLCSSDFMAFEHEFSKTLSSDNNVVKLIGFKTYTISCCEKEHFMEIANQYGEELKKYNTVFSDDFSFYRIYFALHTAIVEYNGKTYTADEKGLVLIPDLKNISKIKVIGRKRSEFVHGTGSNIIEKDRIILKDAFKQEVKNGLMTGYSIEGNACIFDFHAITSMNESCCSKTLFEVPRLKSRTEVGGTPLHGASCIENHGGMNCSDAFGIWGDNCVTKRDRCMDFNGYNSDCSGSGYFLGSDCFKAMALFHCWNEL